MEVNKIYINKEGKATYNEYDWIQVNYFRTGGYFHINEITNYVYKEPVNDIPKNTFQDLRQYMF